MMLKDLIQKFDWNDIKSRYFELYPPYSEETLPIYDPLWKELERLVPISKKSDMTIFIEAREYGHDVYGMDGSISKYTGNPETFAMEFTPWEEWFEMQISEKALKEYAEIDIVCICINEMTTLGLDQKTIEEERLEIERIVDDIKSGKAKLIPWENIKEGLDSDSNLDFERDSYCGDTLEDSDQSAH